MENLKYTIEIAGLKRDLELFPVSDDTAIGAFILFGDVEITEASARELLKIAPKHDIIITSEAKSIPLVYEMTRQLGRNNYIIARKGPKLYMKDLTEVSLKSITTEKEQKLFIGENDRELLNGKKVLIVDDVISTGSSLMALEKLVKTAGGEVVGKMAVLAEGDAIERDDIKVLAPLPLFNTDGTVK